ncbi:hypothetical protein B0E53_05930 [Micromonospora sp. MH33]|nr:hypothetical protein B0E53_05930 [Micromonospora sp. MH33]
MPSANAVPSAASANARQRPDIDRLPCRVKSTKTAGVGITVTPPARARSDSPVRSDCTARCSATSDDEQAVSTVTAGPSKPRAYATRPELMLPAMPRPR